MKFNHIEDVRRYINFLKNISNEGSKWYRDLEWFSSVNYTTTSEYFGELVKFIEKVVADGAFKEQKEELIQLHDTIKACFQK